RRFERARASGSRTPRSQAVRSQGTKAVEVADESRLIDRGRETVVLECAFGGNQRERGDGDDGAEVEVGDVLPERAAVLEEDPENGDGDGELPERNGVGAREHHIH